MTAARALVALAIGFAAQACAGTQLAPEVVKAIEVAECQTANVRALVPHAETADAVVAAARAGDSRAAIALLLQLGMQRKEIEAVADAFASCVEPLVAPKGSDS